MDEHGNFSTLSSDNKEEIRQLLGPRLTLTDDGRIKARREQMNLADEMKFFRFLVTHTSPSVGAQVRAIWDLIRNEVPCAPLPIASIQDEGSVELTWNLPKGYLDLTIRGNGTLEWFVRTPDHFGSTEVEGGPAEPTEELFSQLSSLVTAHESC